MHAACRSTFLALTFLFFLPLSSPQTPAPPALFAADARSSR